MPFALICELLCALSMGTGAGFNPSPQAPTTELNSTETKLPPSVRIQQDSILSQLRIQAALKDAKTSIRQDDFQAAIARLEPEIGLAAGNADFIETLISAYRGQIATLMQQSKPAEARLLRERLAIIASESAQSLAEAMPISPPSEPASTPEPSEPSTTKNVEVEAAVTEPEEQPEVARVSPIAKARDLLARMTGNLPANSEAAEDKEDAERNRRAQSLETSKEPPSTTIPIAVASTHETKPAVTEVGHHGGHAVESAVPIAATYEVRGKQDMLPTTDSRDSLEPFAKAEQLFKEKKFTEALPYYEIAYERNPEQVQSGRARWGYCLLVASIDTYNELLDNPNHPVPETAWANLTGDLKLSAKLAPSMQQYVDEALNRVAREKKRREQLQEVSLAQSTPSTSTPPSTGTALSTATASVAAPPATTPSTSFRHTGTRGQWQVTETQNFIIHHQSQATAEKLAPLLENARSFAFQKWFGDEPDQPWQPRCEVFLYPDSYAYSQGTGEPAQSPGHTKVMNDRGRITSRRLNLRLDFNDMENTVLPHEVTHVVLAGQFGAHAIPRWADEGMAILTEPRAMQEAHLANLAQCHQTGRQFSCGQVLNMSDYPPGGRMRDFYAHSVGICRYLVEKGGPAKLVQFLRTALQSGQNYELALQQVYGIRGFGELEPAFGQYVASLQGGSPRLAAAGR